MERFGRSVLAAAKGDPTPDDGYAGSYIDELARRVLEARPDLLDQGADEELAIARDLAYGFQLGELRHRWPRSMSTSTSGSRSARCTPGARASRAWSTRPSTGCARKGTSSTRTARSGCARPTSATTRTASSAVRTGSYTYFAADAAYYLNKGDRGFAHKIYLLGADHHGYVHRLKALAGAAGDDPDKDIEVLIGQLVSINGARLSKRAGNIIEMDDLREWLGTDALRYSLGRYPADSP